jgi:hypothetical protein
MPNNFSRTAGSIPCDGHVGQLIVWQIQRETHAFDFPEPPEELQRRLIVSLLQSGEIDELLFRATAEVVGVEFSLQLASCANRLGRQRSEPLERWAHQ